MKSSLRSIAFIGVCAITLSGGSLLTSQSTSCEAPRSTLRLAEEAVDSLAGRYSLELVADRPPWSRVNGELVLWVNFEEHLPLLGRARIALDSVGATYMIPMGSFDAEHHDVFAITLEDGLDLTVGRPVVRGGKMNDGAGTRLRVRARTASGFSGTWSAFSGPTTYRADGYFCATRLP